MRRRGCLCFSHGKFHTKPSISYWCESSRTSMAAVWMFIVAKQTEIIWENHQYHISTIFQIHFPGKEPEVEAKGDLESVEKSFPSNGDFLFGICWLGSAHVISWGWFAGLPAWRKKVIWFAVSLIALFVGLISLGNLQTLLIINLPTKHCQHPKLSASNVLHLISLWSCYTVILLYTYYTVILIYIIKYCYTVTKGNHTTLNMGS